MWNQIFVCNAALSLDTSVPVEWKTWSCFWQIKCASCVFSRKLSLIWNSNVGDTKRLRSQYLQPWLASYCANCPGIFAIMNWQQWSKCFIIKFLRPNSEWQSPVMPFGLTRVETHRNRPSSFVIEMSRKWIETPFTFCFGIRPLSLRNGNIRNCSTHIQLQTHRWKVQVPVLPTKGIKNELKNTICPLRSPCFQFRIKVSL